MFVGFVYTGIVSIVGISANFYGAKLVGKHLLQHGHEIVNLAFHQRDQAAAVPELGVGSVKHEEVRKLGNGRAEIRPRVITVPHFVQAHPASSANLNGYEEPHHIKPSCPHHNIYVIGSTCSRHHSTRAELDHSLGFNRHLGFGDCFEPTVIEQHSFPKRRIRGNNLVT